MNQHTRSFPRPSTQAAEGVPRWSWTVAEFDRLIELGVLREEDDVELIGGEMVPMSPKGARHDNVRNELVDWFYRRLPAGLKLACEPGWRASETEYCEPDLLVHRADSLATSVAPEAVLLLVEVADSSLSYDLKIKAAKYASLGVPEYWVIDVKRRVAHIHRQPGVGGYGSVRKLGARQRLVPAAVPEIAVSLTDIDSVAGT